MGVPADIESAGSGRGRPWADQYRRARPPCTRGCLGVQAGAV